MGRDRRDAEMKELIRALPQAQELAEPLEWAARLPESALELEASVEQPEELAEPAARQWVGSGQQVMSGQ